MAGLQADRDVLAGLAEANHDEAVISQRNSAQATLGSSKKTSQDRSSTEMSTHTAGSTLREPGTIEDGEKSLRLPTDEELRTLRHVPDKIPWNAYLIAFVEFAERFSYYGATIVFTNFIQKELPTPTGKAPGNGQPGALGMGQQVATGITTFNSFWVYIIPLFGAYVADTHWGRFKTISICVGIALIGHILLVISAIPGVIEHRNGALACFIVAIIIMGLGTGGFKANISPLVAEQYTRTQKFVGTSNGKPVIVDPALTTSRIYMYFYFFINCGALTGQIGMTFSEKNVGFWLAYLLPTIVFCLCPIVLFIGRNRYARSAPTGSVLVTALRLWRFAARNRWSWNPIRCWRNMRASGFWDDAKPSRQNGEAMPKWMTFDDQWVDEVRRGFKACAVFVWFPIYWLAYNQLTNNLIAQASTMSTHGVPNDLLSNLDPIALIIVIPICDKIIYPFLRRRNINFSPIRRITLGFFTGSAAMIWAAVLQHYIYKTNPCGYEAASCDAPNVSPINVWTQSGAYVLIALSEIFASITGLEYAFTKAPKNMRSLVMSVFLFASAIAAALGEAFVSLSTDPLLVWNYGTMAVLSGVAGVLFYLSFRHLDAAEEQLNNLQEGHVDEKH